MPYTCADLGLYSASPCWCAPVSAPAAHHACIMHAMHNAHTSEHHAPTHAHATFIRVLTYSAHAKRAQPRRAALLTRAQSGGAGPTRLAPRGVRARTRSGAPALACACTPGGESVPRANRHQVLRFRTCPASRMRASLLFAGIELPPPWGQDGVSLREWAHQRRVGAVAGFGDTLPV